MILLTAYSTGGIIYINFLYLIVRIKCICRHKNYIKSASDSQEKIILAL